MKDLIAEEEEAQALEDERAAARAAADKEKRAKKKERKKVGAVAGALFLAAGLSLAQWAAGSVGREQQDQQAWAVSLQLQQGLFGCSCDNEPGSRWWRLSQHSRGRLSPCAR